MLNIKIIAIGKLKESFWQSASEEYQKRLSRFVKLSILELPEEKISEKASPKEEEQVKDAEASRMLAKVKDNEFVILLSPEGKTMTSEKFAELFEQKAIQGVSNLTLVIGGSLGLGEAVKERGDMKISFSPMTFPHQLFRVMLLEQIYRACKINANEIYHK